VVWEGVIAKETMWAYPREHSAKQQMRRCYAELKDDKLEETMATTQSHAEYLREKFSEEKQYALMVAEICDTLGISTEEVQEEVLDFE
jgi:DNA-directed RNA polymerase specialized sigma subunit